MNSLKACSFGRHHSDADSEGMGAKPLMELYFETEAPCEIGKDKKMNSLMQSLY